jgi:hypothetical protein
MTTNGRSGGLWTTIRCTYLHSENQSFRWRVEPMSFRIRNNNRIGYVCQIRHPVRQQENSRRTSCRAKVKSSVPADYVISVNLYTEESVWVLLCGGTRNSPGKINTSVKFWQEFKDDHGGLPCQIQSKPVNGKGVGPRGRRQKADSWRPLV